MLAASDDSQLISRVRAGDLGALGELYDRYRLLVFRTALAITRDKPAAEDILQECFLRLNAHADRLDGTLPLAPWLYRVTVNLSYSWVGRAARRFVSLEGVLEQVDRFLAPGRAAPEQHAEARDVHESVRAAVQALPFHQRAVIVLHYLAGLDVKEIAYILDCPIGTVKSRLFAGRERLRERLVDRVDADRLRGQGVVYDPL